MQLAIVAAGFTPDEADELRRAMAAWRRKGDKLSGFSGRFIGGMIANGYPEEFAQRCFGQLRGFSEYGFPESHAASFAILVYVSCWLKHYHAEAFAAALINSQPMGFYQPSQIVRDAREHGAVVRGVDVNFSGWDCTLELIQGAGGEGGVLGARAEGDGKGASFRARPALAGGRKQRPPATHALRLGMRQVKGLKEADARLIEGCVAEGGACADVATLWRRSSCSVASLKRLAAADAFGSMGLDRRSALWEIEPLRDEELPLFAALDPTRLEEEVPALPAMAPRMAMLEDYQHTGLSLEAHPLQFLREGLEKRKVVRCGDLRDRGVSPDGRSVEVAGTVLVRQRPGTASGVVFITLEDETGIANLIVWPKVFEHFRRVARMSTILLARGKVERQGDVVHVHVSFLESLDGEMEGMESVSRDFH